MGMLDGMGLGSLMGRMKGRMKSMTGICGMKDIWMRHMGIWHKGISCPLVYQRHQ